MPLALRYPKLRCGPAEPDSHRSPCFAHGPVDTSCVGVRHGVAHPCAVRPQQNKCESLLHLGEYSSSAGRPILCPLRCIQRVYSPTTVRVIQQQSTIPQRYISRVEYARLETATLKDVTDDYYYGCSCQSCLRTARLSLSKLRSHLGDDFPLRKIRERLKCEACGSRKVTITFLSPHQKGGNLRELFQKPFK